MKRRHLTATVAVLALALAACGDDDTSTSDSAASESSTSDTAADEPASGSEASEATITITGFSFGDPITVAAGTTVTVVNDSDAEHTLTAADGSFDTGAIPPGGSATITLEAPGTFAFSCSIHSSMQGSITVT